MRPTLETEIPNVRVLNVIVRTPGSEHMQLVHLFGRIMRLTGGLPGDPERRGASLPGSFR